uniref:Uncharacterized protein n=1 Tax=Rhizophora mucronata TaxID=61149 RepID=A0A2P2QEF9_RHIMU
MLKFHLVMLWRLRDYSSESLIGCVCFGSQSCKGSIIAPYSLPLDGLNSFICEFAL